MLADYFLGVPNDVFATTKIKGFFHRSLGKFEVTFR